MREAMKTIVVVAGLLSAAVPAAVPAAAQDAKPPAAENAMAEDAFLKTYFKEKELKQINVAEKEYAEIAEKYPDAREVLARSLLGRARCLRFLKRDEESRALFQRVAKDFTELSDAAKEAADALRAAESAPGAPIDARVRTDLGYPTWREEVSKYGERGVPALTKLLRDESPETVYRAAETLARMDAPSGHDALLAALAKSDSTYPEQLTNAAMSGYAGAVFLRRLGQAGDAKLRAFALERLVFDLEDKSSVDAAVSDPAIAAKMIAANKRNSSYGRLLVAALAKGGETRAAALARLHGDPIQVEVIGGLQDPPPAVLTDTEALAAIAPLVLVRNRQFTTTPVSPALTAALLRHPETAVAGVRFALTSKLQAEDPEALVAAIAKYGVGQPNTGGDWTDGALAEALVAALGRDPAPALLKQLAAVWPSYHEGNFQRGRLPAFVSALIKSGVTSEEQLLALQEGLSPEDDAAHEDFVAQLRDTQRRWPKVGAWAVKAFLYELALPTGNSTHDRAAEALEYWAGTYPQNAGLAAHTKEIVAALGKGGSDHLIAVLRRLGPASVAELKAALPDHPHRDTVVRALVEFGEITVAADVERILRSSQDEDTVTTMARALIRLQHDAAEQALADAIVRDGGKFAFPVFEAFDDLGVDVQRRLVRVAVAKAPGALSKRYGNSSNFSPLTQQDRRELVREALASPSDDDRFWAAKQEKELLDLEAWDRLLAAAQDTNYEIRDAARDALRAIRDKENEIEQFRAMGQERATRKRIEGLIASSSSQPRRAGIAAIAATGLPGMVNELIRLAAEDPDDAVRDDARKALLAMAKPAVPAAPAPEQK